MCAFVDLQGFQEVVNSISVMTTVFMRARLVVTAFRCIRSSEANSELRMFGEASDDR